MNLIKDNIEPKQKRADWANIEEADSDDDDKTLMDKVRRKADGYGEYVTHEEILNMLQK